MLDQPLSSWTTPDTKFTNSCIINFRIDLNKTAGSSDNSNDNKLDWNTRKGRHGGRTGDDCQFQWRKTQSVVWKGTTFTTSHYRWVPIYVLQSNAQNKSERLVQLLTTMADPKLKPKLHYRRGVTLQRFAQWEHLVSWKRDQSLESVDKER